MTARIVGRTPVLGAIFTAVTIASPVWAQGGYGDTATEAELADVVRQQAAEIDRLKSRLDALERDDSTQATASATESGASAQSPDLRVDWSAGAPTLSSRDGEYSFTPSGRVQYDIAVTEGSRYDGADGRGDRNLSGSEFRRLYLGVAGALPGPFGYKLEIDFADSDADIRDAYLSASQQFAQGRGELYLGSKFADRSLSGATSSKFIWFLERNPVANAILPASGYYDLGVDGEFIADRGHVSLGVSQGSTESPDTDADNVTVLSRAHVNPIAADRRMVHLGAWGFYEDFSRDRQDGLANSLQVASAVNDNARIVSGVLPDPEQSTGYGFELAGLVGPFAAAAEYGRRDIDAREGDDRSYDAYSAQIGYSITGETFGYSAARGTWRAPQIDEPVGGGGWGVWQVMARYDALDYGAISGAFDGGSGHGATLGLSWWTNDYTRFMLNYIRWQTDNPSLDTVAFPGKDDGNTIAARAQIVF